MYTNRTQRNNTKNDAIRKKAKELKLKKYNENKGNWCYSFYQKNHDLNVEASLKVQMCPITNGFNPNHIHQYINPLPSKEEQLLEKYKNGFTLKTSEQIIIDNYTLKQSEAIKKDYIMINTHKFKATPQTREGKIKLLFMDNIIISLHQ